MSVAKVAFVNLGCRVNRVETDVIAAELERASCEIVGEADAEAIVINTCAVTGEAEAKTRKAIRRAAAAEGVSHVIATGCMAGLFEAELTAISPKVRVEVSKQRVPALAAELLGAGGGREVVGQLQAGGQAAVQRVCGYRFSL